MSRTSLWLIAFAAAVALAFIVFHKKQGPERLNILVVSSCSVRPDEIGPRTPQIAQWAEGGVVFDNAIAVKPWENFGTLSSDILSPNFLKEQGYLPLGIGDRVFKFYIPPASFTESEWYFPGKSVLSFQDSLNALKKELTAPHEQPFFTVVHLKYMHYPYFDDVNFKDWSGLTPESQRLLKHYRESKSPPDAKIPFFEILFNDFDLLSKRFRAKKRVLSAAGVVSDPVRDKAWAESDGFSGDLKLLRELHELKLQKFDQLAASVLNLFGDRDLASRTVVIFTGDHGEAFMEHGVIGHSVNLYDEMLRYPLIVKFPGSTKTVHVPSQIGHLELAHLLQRVIAGEINADNFASEAQKAAPDRIVSRNCAYTVRSVRDSSEWKLIKNLNGGGNELYNLKRDPAEKTNLIEQKPEIAWTLEEYLIAHQNELTAANPSELATRVCLTR